MFCLADDQPDVAAHVGSMARNRQRWLQSLKEGDRQGGGNGGLLLLLPLLLMLLLLLMSWSCSSCRRPCTCAARSCSCMAGT